MEIYFWISIFSFIFLFGVASIFTRLDNFNFLNSRSARFETVDGLRGFLALSVFFHHFAITYYWKTNGIWTTPPQRYYENYGIVGVGIFFMITGFLFVSKIIQSKGILNWLKLYESRLFRIFPLYIFVVIIITITAFDRSGWQLNSSPAEISNQIIKWALFVGGDINELRDTKLVIAGVHWSLRYEWLFYCSLPLLSFAITKGRFPFTIIIISLCMILFQKPISFYGFTTKFFLLFAVGGICSRLASSQGLKIDLSGSKTASAASAILALFSLFYPRTFDFFHITIISVFFALIVLGCDLFGLLRTKTATTLGEISYSIYLLHGVVLYTIFTHLQVVDVTHLDSTTYYLLMPAVGIVVITLSCLTHIFIEKPFIEISKEYRVTKGIELLATNANKLLQRAIR